MSKIEKIQFGILLGLIAILLVAMWVDVGAIMSIVTFGIVLLGILAFAYVGYPEKDKRIWFVTWPNSFKDTGYIKLGSKYLDCNAISMLSVYISMGLHIVAKYYSWVSIIWAIHLIFWAVCLIVEILNITPKYKGKFSLPED